MDKVVELLSELLVRQDRTEGVLNEMAISFDNMGKVVDKLADSQERLITIQERQEKILIRILEVLADDVPKFDELIEMEQLEDGKKIVLRKSRK